MNGRPDIPAAKGDAASRVAGSNKLELCTVDVFGGSNMFDPEVGDVFSLCSIPSSVCLKHHIVFTVSKNDPKLSQNLTKNPVFLTLSDV